MKVWKEGKFLCGPGAVLPFLEAFAGASDGTTVEIGHDEGRGMVMVCFGEHRFAFAPALALEIARGIERAGLAGEPWARIAASLRRQACDLLRPVS